MYTLAQTTNCRMDTGEILAAKPVDTIAPWRVHGDICALAILKTKYLGISIIFLMHKISVRNSNMSEFLKFQHIGISDISEF